MDDQRTDRERDGIAFFGNNGPLGPWPEENEFTGELGCAYPLLGFVVFLIVLVILWQRFFS
jgi:hypothetical protein